MRFDSALCALAHHLGQPPTWMDVVTGFDYGFLTRAEVQAWARAHDPNPQFHPACHRLAMIDPEVENFQNALWDSCVEAQGSVFRIGQTRWLQSQDRWRVALIQEALEGDLSLHALAIALERIYDAFGCPDDMLHLWRRRAPWEKGVQAVDLPALQAFLARCLKAAEVA